MKLRLRLPVRSSRGQIALLLGLTALELVALSVLWFAPPAPPVVGFLIKMGRSYIVAYRNEERQYQTRSCDSLREALSFAKELKLETGHNPIPAHELEHAWMTPRFGNYVVLWKSLGYSMVSRMTFDHEADARFFVDAFRRGSYSPSLFGHSVLLLPADRPVR